MTALAGQPTGSVYPTKDDAGNLLTTEYGLSTYRDSQSITLQEMPECAPPGQLPRSVDIILEDDLVDNLKPGDRARIVGLFKAVPGKSAAAVSGVFRTLIVATSVQQIKGSEGGGGSALDFETAQRIRSLAENMPCTQLFELLGDSLAPSICGHAAIKRALVLLLLGGLEKNLKNGGHLRGDINCLLVGDPSVAKSQLLRAVMHVAPLAISTTGRGSSGVGLTAAVTSDADTGERKLEAGAMVLADGGVVCIDEFDKMSDADRVAIHEVMEQQTVTIAKAGIHASLNARCSVLAAANPIYGSYDLSLSVTRNVALPDSLLSRFDLLFVVLDQASPAADREIAAHVLSMHAYRPPGDDGAVGLDVARGSDEGGPGASTRGALYDVDDNADEAGRGANSIYAKPVGRGAKRKVPLSVAFLKKYIQFAKNRPRKPQLTQEAADHISSEYADWRRRAAEDRAGSLPVTARTLETMIRLATAHAKMRLGNDITRADAEAALDVMRFALGAEEVTTRRAEHEAENTRAVRQQADDQQAAAAQQQRAAQPATAPVDGDDADMVDAAPGGAAFTPAVDDDDDAAAAHLDPEAGPSQGATDTVFQALVDLLQRRDECTVDDLMARVGTGRAALSREVVEAVLEVMSGENRIMFQPPTIYKI